MTNDVLISTAGRYIGCLPVLSDVGIWFSTNKNNDKNVERQLFCLDHEDVRHLQCFIDDDEVDDPSGPTLMINTTTIAEHCKKIGYRFSGDSKRLDDEILDDNMVFCAAGKKSPVLALDTSRYFHAGSRSSSKPRSVIITQYTTQFACIAKAYRKRGLSHLVGAAPRSIENKTLS